MDEQTQIGNLTSKMIKHYKDQGNKIINPKKINSLIFDLEGYFCFSHRIAMDYSILNHDGIWSVEFDATDNENNFLIELYGTGSTFEEALIDCLQEFGESSDLF